MKAISRTDRKAVLTGVLTGIGVQWIVTLLCIGVFALLIHMELIVIEFGYLYAAVSIAVSSWTGCCVGCIRAKKCPAVIGAGISAGFFLIAFLLHALVFSESTGNIFLWMIIQLMSAAGACFLSVGRKRMRIGHRKTRYR